MEEVGLCLLPSAPEGPRPVATGAAQPASSRAKRNPWTRAPSFLSCPGEAEEAAGVHAGQPVHAVEGKDGVVDARFAVLHAGELGAERSHQVLAVKRLPDAVLALTIVHDPWSFRGV